MSADSEFLIAEIPKNTREILNVTLSEYRGHKLLHFRIWVTTQGDDAQTIPTKSGFGVRLDRLPALRKALEDAEEKAREIGWTEASSSPSPSPAAPSSRKAA